MEGLAIRPVLTLGRPGPVWRPALGQAVQAAPMSPPSAVATVAAPKPELIDSALFSFAFDVLGATASGMLAYGAATRKSKVSYFFGIMAGVLGFKAIADMSEIRNR